MAQIDKKIGEKIKQIRKSLGLSQIELAERVGVSFQQIQKYEKGASKISAFRLHQISEALGTDIATFFEPEKSALKVSGPTLEYSPPPSSPSLNEEEITLLKLFRKIKSKKLRAGILKIIKAALELEKKK